MAVIYLRSTDGNDADSGATWALAKATLASALTAAGAGGTVYVADGHAETQASAMTLTSGGTLASPVHVICVVDTSDPEPPTTRATTATVSTTGASNLTFEGSAYYYGITFTAGSSTSAADLTVLSAAANHEVIFDTCGLTLGGNNTSSDFIFLPNAVNNSNRVRLLSTTLTFSNTSNRCLMRVGDVEMRGGSIAGTIPTAMLVPTSGPSRVVFHGVDLSAAGSGKSLVSLGAQDMRVVFVDCKLGTSVSITTGSFTTPGASEVTVVNSDSAPTNYRFHRANYAGTETQETTIVRTGGASDGTTPFARKVVTTANAEIYSPYESMWVEAWNDTTGSSVTATIETVTDNVTLTDAEAWIEVEYLGTSGFPLGLFAHDRTSDPILGTPANQATSTETWTTTPPTPVKQKLVSAPFTPQEKGIIRARPVFAKANLTVWYDPKLTVA